MRSFFTFISFIFLANFTIAQPSATKLTSYVDPFIGTGGTGHTFPGATLPHGMVQLSPDTRTEGWESCAGYYFPDREILGFSHTHLSGTGVPDLGDLLILPLTGTAKIKKYANGKPFIKQAIDKKSEKASPGYYSVLLPDAGITAELSCTDRVGWHRYSFNDAAQAKIFIDLEHRDKLLEASLQQTGMKEITGHRISEGWARRQHLYFVMQFSENIEITDKSAGPYSWILKPEVKTGVPLIIKVGISAVSIERARKNLNAESPGWDFDAVVKAADQRWEKELSKIVVKSDVRTDLVNFYTSMYHLHIAPNIFCDVDSMYLAMDGKTYKAEDFTPYTVFSLWDTYRAAHPLFTIIDRKRTEDYIKTMLDHYKKAGHLPVWELDGNETWCMIGYHSVSVIADAYVKGITNFDTKLALEAMIESANAKRFGIDHYVANGYVPAEKSGESVSKTLEYAYDDWCIAQFANAIGNMEVYNQYMKRAQYYKNLMDPKSGFMRARSNNIFLEPFLPTDINMHYTEGNSWHYSFTAVQDIDNFKRFLGGEKALEQKLDELFNNKNKLTGREQSDVTGLIGQYAHGNEPSHHIAYLYNQTASPWKTQELTRKIVTELYKNDAVEGLCGNEDCGQMSAWYIMSALGLYPLSPGNDYFELTSPLFDEANIRLENGKTFRLLTKGNVHFNPYIQEVTIAGRPLDRSYIMYSEILNAAPLTFLLDKTPNKNLWTKAENRSPSAITKNKIVPLPFVSAPQTVFVNNTSFSLHDLEPAASLWYSFDKEALISKYIKYTKPVVVEDSKIVYYYAKMPDGSISNVVSTEFRKLDPRIKVLSHSTYSNQYPGGGDYALVDLVKGGNDYRSLAWQGYEGNDLAYEVDLGSIKNVNSIGLSVLQDQKSWIFFPVSLSIQTSTDGVNYTDYGTVINQIPADRDGAILQELTVKKEQSVRFVRVNAKSMGKIPEWHLGAGNKPWIFADEIVIK